jgi:L-seryl-tRNA(Ser) seleniumtransferase
VTENALRSLPSVDRLLATEDLRGLREESPGLAAALAREALDEARKAILDGNPSPGADVLTERVLGLATAVQQASLRPVINATGVIIQTNLGRVPLSDAARMAMDEVSRGYSNLEFDLEAGERGSRNSHLGKLIARVTDAESGLVVNNNAAAILLVLSALCKERDVIVSRGQAVEIGGGFRIPDVMRQSGARLVEVGTTNRTYASDYENAVGPGSAAILRVHSSNFRVVGFTHEPTLRDTARVAREHGLLLIDDVGSGCLVDVTQFGLAPEPVVQESITAGADLVLYSGDKLLGGPQAGIIAGRRELIESLQRHPLMRALRPDKSTIAGLQATLLHYVRGEHLSNVPVWRMITVTTDDLNRRATEWARAVGDAAKVIDGESMIGGGSLPGQGLPTRLLAVAGDGGRLTEVSQRLRLGDPAVVARIDSGHLLLDPRTVEPEDDEALLAVLRSSMAGS